MATIETAGINEATKQIEKLLSTDPDTRKKIQGIVRQVLKTVKANLSKSAQSGLEMKSDPRKSYKAVQMLVYKRLLGGNINILQRSRASGQISTYQPPRSSTPGQVGGNRMTRSERTQQIMSYQGADRGFILRFLNAGTDDRQAGFGRNGKTEREKELFAIGSKGLGNRGSISARNWFGPRSQQELENASEYLQRLVDEFINREFK